MKVFSPKAMHFRLRTGMVFFVFFMFQKVFSWRLRFDEKFHFLKLTEAEFRGKIIFIYSFMIYFSFSFHTM